jgi:hypothetical protein
MVLIVFLHYTGSQKIVLEVPGWVGSQTWQHQGQIEKMTVLMVFIHKKP